MRGLSLVLLWGGAGLALIASGQSWWTAGTMSVTGNAVTSGAASVLVLAGLAGGFLSRFLATTTGRLIIVLVGLLFAAGVALALAAAAPASLPGSSLNESVVNATPWRWIYAGALVLAMLGALVALIAKPAGPRPAATPDPALDAWKALDAGTDPTEPSARAVGGEPPSDQQQ